MEHDRERRSLIPLKWLLYLFQMWSLALESLVYTMVFLSGLSFECTYSCLCGSRILHFTGIYSNYLAEQGFRHSAEGAWWYSCACSWVLFCSATCVLAQGFLISDGLAAVVQLHGAARLSECSCAVVQGSAFRSGLWGWRALPVPIPKLGLGSKPLYKGQAAGSCTCVTSPCLPFYLPNCSMGISSSWCGSAPGLGSFPLYPCLSQEAGVGRSNSSADSAAWPWYSSSPDENCASATAREQGPRRIDGSADAAPSSLAGMVAGRIPCHWYTTKASWLVLDWSQIVPPHGL